MGLGSSLCKAAQLLGYCLITNWSVLNHSTQNSHFCNKNFNVLGQFFIYELDFNSKRPLVQRLVYFQFSPIFVYCIVHFPNILLFHGILLLIEVISPQYSFIPPYSFNNLAKFPTIFFYSAYPFIWQVRVSILTSWL